MTSDPDAGSPAKTVTPCQNTYSQHPIWSGTLYRFDPYRKPGDITVRALETLAAAKVIACEDTRVTATLIQKFGLKTPLLAYHEHNADKQRPKSLLNWKPETRSRWCLMQGRRWYPILATGSFGMLLRKATRSSQFLELPHLLPVLLRLACRATRSSSPGFCRKRADQRPDGWKNSPRHRQL